MCRQRHTVILCHFFLPRLSGDKEGPPFAAEAGSGNPASVTQQNSWETTVMDATIHSPS